jgi:hypothetical protein
VFDLDPGVHLHEEEAPVLVEQELHRTGVAVPDRRSGQHRSVAHLAPEFRVECRARALLDQLLMPSLNRAVSLAEMNDVPMIIAHHLYLDVPWPGDILLHVHGRVVEGSLGLVARHHEGAAQQLLVLAQPHALPSTSR